MKRKRKISMREAAAITTFTTIFAAAPFYLLIGSWAIPIGFFVSAVLVGKHFKYDAGGLAAGLLGVISIIWNIGKTTHLPFWAAALLLLGALIVLPVLLFLVGAAKERLFPSRGEHLAG
ncbi:hypothetical protein [Actinophytocola sp.]|uniref:hypothetical protein n=1 Tax=Actinophytocola sp. TaxID=1872138 RepID=UPI00389B1D12